MTRRAGFVWQPSPYRTGWRVWYRNEHGEMTELTRALSAVAYDQRADEHPVLTLASPHVEIQPAPETKP